MSETKTVTVKVAGLTLSKLLWQESGERVDGLVERCLPLNPGLSASVILPVGSEVTIPVLEPHEKGVSQSTQLVQLFN